jgi:hypothetical protein
VRFGNQVFGKNLVSIYLIELRGNMLMEALMMKQMTAFEFLVMKQLTPEEIGLGATR